MRVSDAPPVESIPLPRRIELIPELPPVSISSRVLNELYQHALETLPEECCGLLTGSDLDRHLEVYTCRNEMTRRHQIDPQNFPRDGREGFCMNELDYLRADEQADEQGQRVTAVYHSHVGFGVYLSELDLEFAEHRAFPFPAADQIVIAVQDQHIAGVGLFARHPDGSFAEGRSVVASNA